MITRLFTLWLVLASVCAIAPAQATVSTTAPRNDYVGNGATATYSYTFKIFAATDLRVTTRTTAGVETRLTYPTDYAVTGVGNKNGGTITLTAGVLTTDYALTIRFDRTPRQSTDLRNQGSFFAETHEEKFDELTRYAQQLDDVVDRSLHLPETEAGTEAATTLPAATERASKFLAWDGDGNPIAAAGTSADLTPVSSFMNTLLDDGTAAAARTTLGAASQSDYDAQASIVTSLKQAARNPIINGNMEIWQRGATFAAAATGQYAADRWKWVQSGAGVVTLNRSTNVPTVAQAGILFNYSLEVDVTTADASIAAGDFYYVAQPIEGYNWRHFAQRDVMVSFWVMSPKTGAHAVALNNTGRNRAATANYTVNVADTWEYKSVSFAASPSGGTWSYTSGEGALLSFALAVGSNSFNTSGSGAWETSAAWHGAYGAGPVNAMDSTANFFRITGVKVELGDTATPVQFVPFEEELERCQRYYQKSFNYATAPAQNAGYGTGDTQFSAMAAGVATNLSPPINFSVRMRGTPTITLYNPSAANAQVRNQADSADLSTSLDFATRESGFNVSAVGTAGTAVGEQLSVHWAADAEL